jgi:hypothetical protein
MKKQIVFLFLTVLLASHQSINSQGVQKGILIDEWDRTTCEDERGRIDNLSWR